MKIATITTKKNLCELKKFADYVQSNNIKSLGVSPVVELGRVKDYEPDLLLDKERVGNIFNKHIKFNFIDF